MKPSKEQFDLWALMLSAVFDPAGLASEELDRLEEHEDKLTELIHRAWAGYPDLVKNERRRRLRKSDLAQLSPEKLRSILFEVAAKRCFSFPEKWPAELDDHLFDVVLPPDSDPVLIAEILREQNSASPVM